jgi:uncharacterized small protein (DUF1192 family)
MNEALLSKLSSPVFESDEAQKIMHEAGQEIVRLQKRVDELTEYNHHLQDQVERLSLDLGLKNYVQFSQH